jgi:hypothetical protein
MLRKNLLPPFSGYFPNTETADSSEGLVTRLDGAKNQKAPNSRRLENLSYCVNSLLFVM